MQIVIAGAYAIGTHLAKLLARANEDITLIDTDEERLNKILSREQEEGDQQGIESKVKESYNNINPLGI